MRLHACAGTILAPLPSCPRRAVPSCHDALSLIPRGAHTSASSQAACAPPQHPVGELSTAPVRTPAQHASGTGCGYDIPHSPRSQDARADGPQATVPRPFFASARPQIDTDAALPGVPSRTAPAPCETSPFTCPHAAARAGAHWPMHAPLAASVGSPQTPAGAVSVRASCSHPNLRSAIAADGHGGPAAVIVPGPMPVGRANSSCLPSSDAASQDYSYGPRGLSRRIELQLSERANMLAAFYALHPPTVGVVEDSTSQESSSRRSVSRRRSGSGRVDNNGGGGGSALARSCPVQSAFAAAAAEEPAFSMDLRCGLSGQSRDLLGGAGSDW